MGKQSELARTAERRWKQHFHKVFGALTTCAVIATIAVLSNSDVISRSGQEEYAVGQYNPPPDVPHLSLPRLPLLSATGRHWDLPRSLV